MPSAEDIYPCAHSEKLALTEKKKDIEARGGV